jgi:hypothetical protein
LTMEMRIARNSKIEKNYQIRGLITMSTVKECACQTEILECAC